MKQFSMEFVIFIFVLMLPIAISCPSKEDIFPCVCEWPSNEGSAYVTCSGLDNEQDLVKAVGSFVGKNYVYSLIIENSNFNFIPHDAFKGARFVELEIKDSFLMALTDTEVAFVGLENYLENLLMTDCIFMNDWDWSILKNMHKLMRLDIVGGVLEIIGEDLQKINITNVESIAFTRNRISYIYDFAFAKFKNLRILFLDNNAIKEIKRTMIPDPALELISIDVSNNEIEQLPEDLCKNMPNLKDLNISYNKILVLNEKTFAPVWEQLELFGAVGNELRCDCRMSWLLEKKFPGTVRGVCAKPLEVKGRSLELLTSKDLWC